MVCISLCRGTVLVAFALVHGAFGHGCIEPAGIDFGNGAPCVASECLPSSDFEQLMDMNLLQMTILTVGTPQPGLAGVETPIVNHWTASNIGQVYSAVSAYEPLALEFWGRHDVSSSRRRCSDNISAEDFALHRKVTLAYTLLYVFSTVEQWEDPVGGAEVPLRELAMNTWGIDFDLCDLNRDRANDKMDNCDDIATPWGLAIELVKEILEWFTRDGWNRNGDLSGAMNNRIPYEDWRSRKYRYIPTNDPWTLRDETRWQPLKEHNGNGFVFYQEHVTPHIGESARSIFFEDSEICDAAAELEDPKYRLRIESAKLLRRTAALDDRSKARIELFDNKLISLSPLVGQYFGKRGIGSDTLEFIMGQVANLHALRESTILVWKSKVDWDLVRPTSFIQKRGGDAEVLAYGGPDVGETATVKASDFQPYIRVMPHAEYPSGSACLCTAFADALIELTGSDTFVGPPDLTLVKMANTSVVEENRPREDQAFTYTCWSQIARECGQSRLDGGMHFTASVPNGHKLCRNVGAKVSRAIKALAAGESPEYIVPFDIDRSTICEDRCSDKSHAEIGR